MQSNHKVIPSSPPLESIFEIGTIRRSSNTWDDGKCNPDPHPRRPRSGPSSPSPISIIQPALVRLVCLSWRVTIHYPKRDFLSIRCW